MFHRILPDRVPALLFTLVLVFVVSTPRYVVCQEPGEMTAIVGVTIIDGNGNPPIPDGTLVIEGERIFAVGPRSSVQIPDGTQVIDGAGKYITPGFIDSNVHLSLYGSGPASRHLDLHETLVRYENMNANLTLEAAQLQLKHGFTTVRDSYGSLIPLIQIRDAIARGDTVGPRMLVAGNIVGWGGPYSETFSGTREEGLTLFQEQFNDFITQGSGEELMHMESENLRLAINDYLDIGPNFIKYGGTSHSNAVIMIGFSPDAQKVLVEETHKRGLVAETHSTSPEGLWISVLAGVDLIQHPEALPNEIPDALVKEIVERGTVCAMIANTVAGPAWERHLEEREKMTAADEHGRRRDGLELTSAERRAEARAKGDRIRIRRLNAEKLIANGCVTTIGTDNYLGSAPELRREVKFENQSFGIGSVIATEGLVELGMTPMEAIVAITRNGAIACKMLDELGTLDVGKYADIVILDANPLEDISNIRAIHAVIRNGTVVDLDALPYERIFSTPGKGHAW